MGQAPLNTQAKTIARAAPRAGSIRRGRILGTGLRLLLLVLGVLFALYPVVWILSSALSPSNSIINAQLIPANASTVNFSRLTGDPQHPWLLWMWNSIKVSTITAVITVVLCALAAYSFSRFRYRGRREGLLAILLVQLFPNMLAIVALFLLLQQLGKIPGFGWMGLNTLGGLILVYSGGALGFNTWLMKGFFDAIPKDLDESALIDGASYMQVFLHIMLPLIRPILAVIAILSFIGTYSDYLIARVMITSSNNYTLALGMTLFIRGQYTQQYGAFSAAALVGALPIVLIFLLLQRQLIGGLAQGAVKG